MKDVDSAVLERLKNWEKLVFENESQFLKYFCHKATDLTKISWGSNRIFFTYVMDCGQHITDDAMIEEWFEFVKTIKQII